jgi:hypothetical protein
MNYWDCVWRRKKWDTKSKSPPLLRGWQNRQCKPQCKIGFKGQRTWILYSKKCTYPAFIGGGKKEHSIEALKIQRIGYKNSKDLKGFGGVKFCHRWQMVANGGIEIATKNLLD